ncbi:MAG: GNAT family N-acetyltransferase [Anaerolineae bacterium]|nr:GNAT family N-acetyltransferase [Anaerolineae bacterium]
MRIPTITTSHLILRAFTEADIEPLHRILGDRDVLRYFPNPNLPSRDKVEKMISSRLKHWEEHGYGWWAVEPRSKRELIGWSGLQFLPETEEVEVAYLLGKAYWGKGLATEAAQACLQYGFENVEVESIVAIVHPENLASQRVIEKLGMLFVDQAHYFGMDCYRYSIERSSFDSDRRKTL